MGRHTKTRQIVLDDRIHHRCAAYLEAIGRIAVTGANTKRPPVPSVKPDNGPSLKV